MAVATRTSPTNAGAKESPKRQPKSGDQSISESSKASSNGKKKNYSSSKSITTSSSSQGEEAGKQVHLPPLILVFVVLFCSGFQLMFSIRDFMMTGRNILGEWDEALLLFSRSTDWYDDSKGWKSQQGGFSAIAPVSTDANNMGGFFVRKLGGAAATAVHLQKIGPLLFHFPHEAHYQRGHFRPLLANALASNLAMAIFWIIYWEDLRAAQAHSMAGLHLLVLGVESLTLIYYLLTFRRLKSGAPAIAFDADKTPSSLPSRIVSRTVITVSIFIFLIFTRDLFLPGTIIEFLPSDDLYLEWTNALIHSPPPGSPEFASHGMEAPLYIGDLFASQYAALHMVLLCMSKFVSAVVIRHGTQGAGLVQAPMMWAGLCVGDALVLFVVRLFAPAANTASLDFRWYVMALAYETFILGLYAFW